MAALAPPLAPSPYRRHRRRSRRGDHDWVVAHTATTLAELGDDAAAERWGPGVLVRLGVALAHRQQPVAARMELTRALGALGTSTAATDLGSAEGAQLQLVEVLVTLGAFAEARARALALCQGGSHPSTRAGAARLLATLHLAGGDVSGAHAWLDEAATHARVLGGDLPLALVHADRSVVVAGSGRVDEGVAMATEALARLSGAGRSATERRWADTQASSTACAVGLSAALANDADAAGYLASAADRLATAGPRPLDAAWRGVLRSAVERLGGNPAAASPLVDRAATTFRAAGAEPAAAAAVREQALVAGASGRHASASALAGGAAATFHRLGMPLEAARTEALAAALTVGDNEHHGS